MSVPDVVITRSRLSKMHKERRGLLREFLDDNQIVDRRVSEVKRTINRRWGGLDIAAKLTAALETAIELDCGPKLVYSPRTGELRTTREQPIKCPVKKCKCQGSVLWHRKLAD